MMRHVHLPPPPSPSALVQLVSGELGPSSLWPEPLTDSEVDAFVRDAWVSLIARSFLRSWLWGDGGSCADCGDVDCDGDSGDGSCEAKANDVVFSAHDVFSANEGESEGKSEGECVLSPRSLSQSPGNAYYQVLWQGHDACEYCTRTVEGTLARSLQCSSRRSGAEENSVDDGGRGGARRRSGSGAGGGDRDQELPAAPPLRYGEIVAAFAGVLGKHWPYLRSYANDFCRSVHVTMTGYQHRPPIVGVCEGGDHGDKGGDEGEDDAGNEGNIGGGDGVGGHGGSGGGGGSGGSGGGPLRVPFRMPPYPRIAAVSTKATAAGTTLSTPVAAVAVAVTAGGAGSSLEATEVRLEAGGTDRLSTLATSSSTNSTRTCAAPTVIISPAFSVSPVVPVMSPVVPVLVPLQTPEDAGGMHIFAVPGALRHDTCVAAMAMLAEERERGGRMFDGGGDVDPVDGEPCYQMDIVRSYLMCCCCCC